MDLGFYAILFGAASLFVLAMLLIGKVRARHRSQQDAAMPLPLFFRIEPELDRGSNGRSPFEPAYSPPRATTGHSAGPAPMHSPGPSRFEPPSPLPRTGHIVTPGRGIAAAMRAPEFVPERAHERAIERAPAREHLPDENTVVFKRHTDGPLELLPGRLEIVEGDGEGRDIRFMRAWGELPEVTFGRSRGPAHRHVQLAAPTVSRNHARMLLDGDRWKITNLSATNPVVINGEELAAQSSRVLDDGDRIEMGEVIFRYRER